MRRFMKPDATGQPAPAGAPPADPPAADPPASPPAADPAAASKTFSQEDVDKLIAARVKRTEAEVRKAVEDDAKKAAMSAEDKLKVELEAAQKASADAVTGAHRILVQAKAEVAAAAAGAQGDNVEAVIKLADLSGVEVAEGGIVDAEAITAAITQIKGKFPSLFGAAGTSRSGGDFQGGADGKRVWTRAEIAAMAGTPEFEEHKADINAAATEGRIRG